MTLKEDELQELKKSLTSFIESLYVKDSKGKLIKVELNEFQEIVLDSLLRKSFYNLRTASYKRKKRSNNES